MHQLARTKAEEEERIAAVLQQRMHDSERKTKELQQLRNESAELRDLQVSSSEPIRPYSARPVSMLHLDSLGLICLMLLKTSACQDCSLRKHADLSCQPCWVISLAWCDPESRNWGSAGQDKDSPGGDGAGGAAAGAPADAGEGEGIQPGPGPIHGPAEAAGTDPLPRTPPACHAAYKGFACATSITLAGLQLC